MKLDKGKKIVFKIEESDIKKGVLKIPEGVETVSDKALKSKKVAALIHKIIFPSSFKFFTGGWLQNVYNCGICFHPDCQLLHFHSPAMLDSISKKQPLEEDKGYVVVRKVDNYYTRHEMFKDISSEVIPEEKIIRLNSEAKCVNKPWTYFKNINSALCNASHDCWLYCNKHRSCSSSQTGTSPFLGKNCPYKILECKIGDNEGCIAPPNGFQTRYLTGTITPVKELTAVDVMNSIRSVFAEEGDDKN